MGIGMLSMPYAMRLSGWAGLAALAASLALFNASAHLLVAGLERLPAGVPRSYPSLGAAAFGPAGRRLVGLLALSEFGGGAIVTFVSRERQRERDRETEGETERQRDKERGSDRNKFAVFFFPSPRSHSQTLFLSSPLFSDHVRFHIQAIVFHQIIILRPGSALKFIVPLSFLATVREFLFFSSSSSGPRRKKNSLFFPAFS